MRTGVAADHVSARVQFADLWRIEKTGTPGPVGGYEEVSAPAALFQSRRPRGVRTDRAIVECQEQRRLTVPLARAVDDAHRSHGRHYCQIESRCARKWLPVQLIPSGMARAIVSRGRCRFVDDVVITDGDSFHWRHLLRGLAGRHAALEGYFWQSTSSPSPPRIVARVSAKRSAFSRGMHNICSACGT